MKLLKTNPSVLRAMKKYYEAHKNEPEFMLRNRDKQNRWYARHKNEPKVKAERLRRTKAWLARKAI